MSDPLVSVVGAPQAIHPLSVALRRAHLRPVPVTPEDALRNPGVTLDARLIVFASPPGAQLPLEAEAYAAGTGALHVAWDAAAAAVGPFVSPGLGPCPACLAHRSGPQAPGAHRALVSWASSWAALQAHAIVRGSTDLVALSWAWQLGRPGLSLVGWQRLPDCRVAGCAQP